MASQVDSVKQEFAKRLHKALDAAGYPVRGRARILSREFNISDKGASKWLNGDAIPETSKIPHLAKFLKVNAEWLLTGMDLTPLAQPNQGIEKLEIKNKEIIRFTNRLLAIEEKKGLTPELINALEAVLSLALLED
ncbi:hypothetical protein ACKEN5_16665 [Acinetobacter baumannii]|uniref:hypothetical protein n=1 Tax=Acinetobacter baumannii TaxID=470 RepID=UPI0038B46C83